MAKLVDQSEDGSISTIAYVQAPGDETDFDREASRQTAPSFGAAVNPETGEGMTEPVKRPMTAEQIREQRRALCCSILTLLMSIPAMIGA